MIIDTDVLISYLYGNESAQKIIHENIPFRISVISYIELIQNARSQKELSLIQKHLKKWSTEIIQINENISSRAMYLLEDYYSIHSLEFAGAVIAATALEKNEALLTANFKFYSFIPNLEINKFIPDSPPRPKQVRSEKA